MRAAREARGYEQKDLAKLMGVSASAVSRWEDGQAPDPDEMARLATMLGVTTDDLLRPSAAADSAAAKGEVFRKADVDLLLRKHEAALRPRLRAELRVALAEELRVFLEKWVTKA